MGASAPVFLIMGGWRKKTDLVMRHAIDAFSEPIRYFPIGLDAFDTNAIIDREFLEVDPDSGVAIQSTDPRIGLRESQLPRQPQQGDKVEMRGEIYRVIDSRTDGQAGVELSLHLEDEA